MRNRWDIEFIQLIYQKNKKFVKITYGVNRVIKEFEVDTFANCFVNDYDSNATCLAHIINGNLYMIYPYSADRIYVTTPKYKDLWTDAVLKSSSYHGCGLYNKQPYEIWSTTSEYCYPGKTINCLQCSGQDNPSAAWFVFLGADGNLYMGKRSSLSLFSTGYKYKFICEHILQPLGFLCYMD